MGKLPKFGAWLFNYKIYNINLKLNINFSYIYNIFKIFSYFSDIFLLLDIIFYKISFPCMARNKKIKNLYKINIYRDKNKLLLAQFHNFLTIVIYIYY